MTLKNVERFEEAFTRTVEKCRGVMSDSTEN